MLKQYKKEAEDVITKLSDEVIWKDTTYKKDKTKTEALIKYLEVVSILKYENIEEILVKHIAYTPFEEEEAKRTLEQKYPVYAALYRVGIKSVNPLVRLLKTTAPNNPFDNSDVLAIFCLADIYEQSGLGKKMVRKRLLLEVEGEAIGKAKEYLERAIKHPGIDPEGARKPTVIFQQLPEKYQKNVEKIISVLSTDATWKDVTYQKDKAKTEILLKYLELASLLRSQIISPEYPYPVVSDVTPILVKNIAYSPFEGQKVRDITIESQYPAYNTLCQIGIRTVGPLVNLLKTGNLDDKTQDLIIRCLVNIYEQGGFGKEMTKYRLQLEMGDSKDKEKELLEKALHHPQLNTKKK